MPQGALELEALAKARELISSFQVVENPYVLGLERSELGRAGFLESQTQFYFAVEYYPRPMAALLSRLPDAAQRLGILRNLLDEHGDLSEHAFHRTTFRQFLERIAGHGVSVDASRAGPQVRAFNATVAAACGLEEQEVGLGCLGIIELAFAEISARIGAAVVARGWLKPAELIHYSLHAELDVKHAQDFFAAAAPSWSSREKRASIVAGLELGAHAFRRLYEELHRIATRDVK